MNTDKENEIEVSPEYKFLKTKKLGSGAFGQIYQGYHTQTNKKYAIKREPTTTRNPQLRHEYDIMNELQGSIGFPSVYLYKPDKDYNYLIMDLLGLSIEELFEYCQRRFTLRTILLIAFQMLERIEHMHSKGFIHRDIKPDNFILGKEDNKLIYIIDFGLSKKYINPETGLHIFQKTGKRLTGTARYASIFTHHGIEQARRDDIESFAFCLAYFCRGSLPWQGICAKKREEKYMKIKHIKISHPPEELLKTHPQEFIKLFYYTREIKFDAQPDYAFIKGLLNNVWKRYEYGDNNEFDWIQHEFVNQINMLEYSKDEGEDKDKEKENNNNHNKENKEEDNIKGDKHSHHSGNKETNEP